MPHSETPDTPCHIIGILDSGVGGLSVFAEIKKRLPNASYIYFCDNKNFPYGSKNSDQIVQIVNDAFTKMTRDFAIDLMVIACNTASTISLAAMREKFSIPIVGVVPAIKPATLASTTKVIGILATEATIRGAYIDNLISQFAGDCKVIKRASFRLVELAEEKMKGKVLDLNRVRDEISPLFSEQLDTVVLGCTHFPLLLEELRAASPWPVNWLSSESAIAARVCQLLSTAKSSDSRFCKVLFSNPANASVELQAYFESLGFSVV